MKKIITITIRILVSFALLVFLLSKIEWGNIKGVLSHFNPLFYILAICVLFAHQLIWSYMWKTALLEKSIKIKSKDIFRTIITSYFFGTFLPSSIGPDIVLTFNIGKSLKEKEHAPGSLMFIRLMNISSILLVSGIVLIFISHGFILKQILRITWFLLLTVWICYYMAIHPNARRFVDKITNRYRFLRFIYKIFHSFSAFGLDNKAMTKIWFLALAMTFLKVLTDYTIALSLGIHIPYIWFLGLVPAVSVISLLPISIAGLGVRESAYVGIFAAMGVPKASSFSISLMMFTLNILLCITGGILYLIHGSYIKSKNLVTTHPLLKQDTRR